MATSKIVSAKPLHDAKELLSVNDEISNYQVSAKSYEAMVWLTVSQCNSRCKNLGDAEGRSVPFPALIDTGCSESLVLSEWHLLKWIKQPIEAFSPSGSGKCLHGHLCPAIRINIWLHPFLNSKTDFDPSAAIKMQTSGALVSYLESQKTYKDRRSVPAPKKKKIAFASMFRGSEAPPEKPDAVDTWLAREVGSQKDDVPVNIYPRLPLLGVKFLVQNKIIMQTDGGRRLFNLQVR